MFNIPGYIIHNALHTGRKTVVYRATRIADKKQVILKILNSDYPSATDRAHLRREYEIICSLNISGIIQTYGIESFKNTSFLVLEDFGGETLKSYIDKNTISPIFFLEISIQIMDILTEIHNHSVIHKDLKPHNILIHPETFLVKISDFSIASFFTRESQKPWIQDDMEGTLAYISPEQTGWMNRNIDYRTDFYTLGITFFEMLSGKLPFVCTDPMELIHSHLAVDPPALHDLVKNIPESISAIVAKLLTKNAEDRYKTSSGIKRDMEFCLKCLKSGKSMEDFIPGSMDISERFHASTQLYGRENEIKLLTESIQRASIDTSEMIIIRGPAGIGKSSLANEAGKKVIEHSGFYIKGKFEQFNKDIPYHGFIEAFNGLINYILTFNPEKLAIWKNKIIHDLGDNAQIMVDFIPRLSLVIGPQPQTAILDAPEAQNRFHRLFQKFLGIITSSDHLLVIFIDDLQWADSSSLKLLKILMANSESKNMVFIGAYRTGSEEYDNVFLLRTLEEIENYRHNFNLYFNQKLPLSFIEMGALEESHIIRFLEDSLNTSGAKAVSLARLVLRRTAGNPLFINQFLISIYQEGLIYFQKEKNTWDWDLGQIKKITPTENVTELLIENVKRSSKAIQDIMQLASCIGNQFDLETLSKLYEKSPVETKDLLIKATKEDYIVLLDESKNGFASAEFQFQHDQIRYTVYSMIPEIKKMDIHKKISDLILDRIILASERNPKKMNLSSIARHIHNEKDLQSLQEWLGENIFSLVNHLNLAGKIIVIPEEVNAALALNLVAAQKARKNAAFETALDYLLAAMERLPNDAWITHYFLTLSLYNETADCEYINTHFEESARLSQIILDNAQSVLDKVRVIEIKIASLTPQNKLNEAVECGLSFLKELGIEISPDPGKFSSLLKLIMTRLKIGNQAEKLSGLPVMKDPKSLAAMDIIIHLTPACFISSPNLVPPLVILLVNLSLKFGISEKSAYGFAGIGMIFGSGLGNFSFGYRLGKLSTVILEKFYPSIMDCKVLFVYGNFVSHWIIPLRESQQILENAYNKGVESGDLLFASYSLNWINAYNFFMRKPIIQILESLEKYEREITKFHQTDSAQFFHLWRQFVINLSDNNISTELSGSNFDEKIAIPVWEKNKNDTDLFTYYLFKAILAYFQKEYSTALEYIELSIPYESGVFGMPVIPEHNFFYSLILASLPDEQKSDSSNTKKSSLKKIYKNQRKLKTWARNSPENYGHKYFIIQGELCRLRQNANAVLFFEKAIESARKYKYMLEEAIANELLSRYYFEIDKPFIAQCYIREAYYHFLNWGIHSKAREMLKEFPEIAIYTSYLIDPSLSAAENFTSSTSETLDFRTILKVSQDISSEIELNKLIEKLMMTILENAGAQNGFIILSRNETYFVEAQGNVESVQVLPSIPLESFEDIPQAIVNYVKMTKEAVILNDTSQENYFQSDPYILRKKPKSVLCGPIIKKNNLIGIFYLENNSMPNVFTKRRLDILNLLTMQAVISIENAIYFEQIQKVNTDLKAEIKLHKKTEEDLRQSRERYALAARGANDGLWDWDLLKNEVYYSARWKEMLGYQENDITSSPEEWLGRIHPDDLAILKTAMDSHLENTVPHFECEYRLQHKDGSYLWIITRGHAVRDSFNRPYRLAGSQTEITKRRIAEDQIRFDALHDNLTGLPNWNLFLDRMMHVLNQKKRQPDYKCCVLFLDLDRFKVINESLGHETGNTLLVKYARLLQNSIRPEDTVARLGGDEFAILLENIADVNVALKVINQIREKLLEPFVINKQELFVTVSIGVLMITNDYQKPEEILRDADTAMHRAKTDGKNRYQIFDKTMHAHVIGFLKLESELRKAIDNHEFLVCYQPVISGNDGRIHSLEALIRWNKNNETLISPGEFIDVAEENGLILPIGRYVFAEACRQIKIWQNMNLPDLTVAINLSPKQFEQEDILEMVDNALKEFNISGKFIHFEITENVLMKDIPHATHILESLQTREIYTSIDDFGTGYSSLNYLKKFPVSKLKIDKSFIQNIHSGQKNDNAIIKAIIAMGKSMKMLVVAEGVETVEQLQFLMNENCNEYQGYFFCKPMPAEALTELLKTKPTFNLRTYK
ncbi:MAG: EAL domain-containing protein [Spirochaetia bacterium]|nr:EAL domain-containing protein [Spirochaetia bacterium]